MDDKPKHLTPEQLHERDRKVMRRLLPHRIVLTVVSFVGVLAQTKRLRPALKEARHAWRLEIFQRDENRQ
jgi:hypothetical protein